MTDQGQTSAERFEETTREQNPILWALQQYQKVVRRWMGALTVIEFAVLMQILDRTVGWQKTRRTIGVPSLLDGGSLYTGIGHTVKKASVMKALRSLEDKGIIERRPSEVHFQFKEYVINLDWSPPPRLSLSNESDFDDSELIPSLYEQHEDGSIR